MVTVFVDVVSWEGGGCLGNDCGEVRALPGTCGGPCVVRWYGTEVESGWVDSKDRMAGKVGFGIAWVCGKVVGGSGRYGGWPGAVDKPFVVAPPIYTDVPVTGTGRFITELSVSSSANFGCWNGIVLDGRGGTCSGIVLDGRGGICDGPSGGRILIYGSPLGTVRLGSAGGTGVTSVWKSKDDPLWYLSAFEAYGKLSD